MRFDGRKKPKRGCGEKISYDTRDRAKEALRNARADGLGMTRWYRCPRCLKFHLTSSLELLNPDNQAFKVGYARGYEDAVAGREPWVVDAPTAGEIDAVGRPKGGS